MAVHIPVFVFSLFVVLRICISVLHCNEIVARPVEEAVLMAVREW